MKPIMSKLILPDSRRTFVKQLVFSGSAFGVAAFTTPGLFAEELTRTPTITEGPFYPNKLPLDTDNDLLKINDAITPAVGQIVHLSGRVLDIRGNAIRNAVVKIWQVDNNGCYIHTRAPNQKRRDKNFQGFGRFLTNAKGEYYFRTIKPVGYTDRGVVERCPHIHAAVELKGRARFVTQFFIKGEKGNKKDFLLKRVRNQKQRELVIRKFEPVKGSKMKELQAKFDIVMGVTPKL